MLFTIQGTAVRLICWDQPVRIAVCGLVSEQPVTLQASLRYEKGALFRAHARYRADAGGELDLERVPALGGSFARLEPVGLIWAVEPDKPYWRLLKRDVQMPFVVELEVLDGYEPDGGLLLARALHELHFMPSGVRRVPVREGRVWATLFLPPGPGPYPGIMDLFGLGGGLLEYRASLLAGKGFAVMALAYYNHDDLPQSVDTLHLEYFEEAVNYLLITLRLAVLLGPGIGLLGISKGGELSLAMSSFLKGITAAVIINGSVAVVGANIRYKDETLPPVTVMRDRVKMTKDGIKDVVEALKSPLEDGKSFIPVERSNTTFLFLVGQDDHNWKSEFYANEASKRLQAHGKEKPQIICYPEAGHYIEPPYWPLCRAAHHVLVGGPIFYGGEPRAHAMAQLDAWKRLQIFFHKHLDGVEVTIPTKL
uniref:Uncharacterized protein n=1 Tax=Sciurus vulgaris TaxID=55149 RepID=A0A8D2CNR3_SCIVU